MLAWKLKKELFEKYPFYDEFLFNTKSKPRKKSNSLKKSIVNKPSFIIENGFEFRK